ncbi:MAG: transglycosylase domain-containing protein [Solirubrobacteraceae bacterium]|jgi:penicillin-binding protein 1A
MTEDDRTGYSSAATSERVASVLSPITPPGRRRRGLFGARKRNRRIRWLRLLAILVPLAFLALISFVFGVVLAFEPQLGPLTKQLRATYSTGRNSEILAAGPNYHQIGILTDHNQFFLTANVIPLVMDNAIVAIEDKRFWTESGVDIRGIARAFLADVFHTGSGTQGASTITEQFIKNALTEEGHRTIFEKVKEAALAFQLSHLWPKKKILAEYLNTAYFGNGAHGIEAAARAYFGNDPDSNLNGCGQFPNLKDPASLCVTYLNADEAALLAGLVNAPTTLGQDLFDNVNPVYARRNLVLQQMTEQGYLTQSEYQQALQVSLPPAADIQSPSAEDVDPSAGYFVQWIENQLTLNKGQPLYRGQSVFSAGYTIHTTLDYDLQQEAQNVVDHVLPAGQGGPAAAVVAIDNATGEVKAMVGGYNFTDNAFNLATQAERQPGSAFKVFDLAVALEDGKNANSEFYSGPWVYKAQAVPFGDFSIHNDEGGYEYSNIPLYEALELSDNTVFSRLGLLVDGESNIASLAHSFGISTTISVNPSMVIGGLQIGVTPLDMAHAYETIANGGNLTYGSLSSDVCAGGSMPAWLGKAPPTDSCPGPVGVTLITQNHKVIPGGRNKTITERVFPYDKDLEEVAMMKDVLNPIGTGAAAAIPGVTAWGKTGTTSNYADAWFVGSTAKDGSVPSMTVAVWVGYPNSNKSMAKDYGGKPVYGGTYPALIWRAYVMQAIQQYKREAAELAGEHSHHPISNTGATGATGVQGVGAPSTATSATGATSPASGTVTSGGGSTAPNTTSPTGSSTPSSGSTSKAGGASTPTGGSTTSTGGSTTPATGSSSPSGTSPPPTGAGGGVSAPGGGTSAPPG